MIETQTALKKPVMSKTLYFGVDYYPEQWDESCWKQDAALMREAGMNVVRLAEFAWGLLEPSDGHFDFGWLDRAIDILGAQGLQVVLGTPSASVPPWFFEAHPESVIVDENGAARTYGSRRDACPAHPVYRAYAVRIAAAMARHYASSPHVIGWQIDNEFGDRSYSAAARSAFHTWLRDHYGTLEAVNRAWGTNFWSHTYTDWAQIPVPRKTTHAPHNPGLHLDYLRFISDLYSDFQQRQIDALRQHVPDHHFITHNFMGFTYGNLDYFDLARALDFVSWDNYPSAFWRAPQVADAALLALGHSAMWGLKRRSFWVMEQQSGASGWHVISPAPQPGQIALWAYQAIAYGADGIVFFRWRTNPKAAEQNWHGILDSDSRPRRRYAEVKQMGAQVAALGTIIAASEVRYQTAILHDYDSRFSFQLQPDNHQFRYEAHVQHYFTALHRKGLPAALLALDDQDLSAYRLIMAPALRLVDDAMTQRLTAYVQQGGILVLTMRSGSRDMSNALVQTALPGRLKDLCGMEVEEWDSLERDASRRLHFTSEIMAAGQASIWCDVLTPLTAEVLATYAEGYYAGKAAITAHRVGRGTVIYVGTAGDEALIESVVTYGLALAQLQPPLDVSAAPHVEVTERWQGTTRLLFLLNHGCESASVALPAAHTDLMTQETFDDQVNLAAFQVRILTQTAPPSLSSRNASREG